MPSYDAVLFDNDGVLVDPPDRADQVAAVAAAFAAVGVPDPDDAHVDALVGGVQVEQLREVAAVTDVDPARLWDARERHDERAQLARFRAGDRGVYDDVDALRSLPGPRGVVSNNHHSTVGFVLEHFDLAPLFEVHFGRPMTVESLRRRKPDPHYLERALAALDAETALFVGDSESDLVAADRAGLDSAFVRRPHTRPAAQSADPTHVVDSLDELQPIVG